MKKYLFLIACMLNTVLASAQYSGSGNGTEDDPYLIYNETQLYQMNNFLGEDHAGVVFKLMKDLDLTEFISENFTEGWTPVGVSSSHFMGKFYGNNHTISGLSINKSIDYVGFWGYIDGATVKDLTLKGISIKGGSYTGTLCGYAANSTISNCSVELSSTFIGNQYSGGLVGYVVSTPVSSGSFKAESVKATNYSGGFVGFVESSTITGCTSNASYSFDSSSSCGGFNGQAVSATFTVCSTTGNISTGSRNIGGFSGEINSTTITNSIANGNVTGSSNVGGFIGYALATCSLSSCKSFGNIKGATNVSGFAGCLNSGSFVAFTSCHSKGVITNTGDYTGGIVGISNGACIAVMTDCSHFGDINAQNYVGGIIGENTGEETDEPKLHEYYITALNTLPSNYANFGPFYDELVDGETKVANISNCVVIGNIYGKNYVGGLAGEINYSIEYVKTIFNSAKNYHRSNWMYLWQDGVCINSYYEEPYDSYYYVELTRYTRNCTITNFLNSSYSGILHGNDYIGGLCGYQEGGIISTCYTYSSEIIGNSYVGGIIGSAKGHCSDVLLTLKSNVAINNTVSATEGNIGRIYGTKNDYVSIGALASAEGNRALTTTKVIKQGVVQEITDDFQNGNVMGKSLLKLKANYVALGWDFDNNWDILETECYPYKKYQAAPPVIESNLVSQDTEISGSSTNGGTVFLYYKDRDAVSTTCDGNAWKFTTEALQSGAAVQLYADVDGMTPSYLTSATVAYPGSGTEADPYRIYTAEDLQGASNKGYYKLMNDIDLTSWINENSPTEGWVAIGRNSGEATYINGDGHKITGLWTNTTQDYTGLFSNFSAGTIKNLTVEVASGKSVKGGDYTGVLIGRNANGQLLNCTVKGDVEGTTHVGGVTGYSGNNTVNAVTYEGKVTSSTDNAYVGGFAGLSESDAVTAVHVYSTISATGSDNYVGGAIGYLNGGAITKSQAENTLTATGANDYVGGLVGYSKGDITLSYSTGTVTASGDNSYTGGLVGYAYNPITNCYSTAKTTGTYYTAGICAYTFSTIDMCYSKGDIYGSRYGGGVVAQLDGSDAALTNSIAANNKLELTDQSSWGSRVIGGFKNGAAEPNTSNYALSTMQVSLNGVAQKKTDDAVEGIAKSEADLMKGQTYIDLGWDYSAVWGIDEGTIYPYLLWEVDVNPVTEITLDKTSVIIASGNTETISASIMPLGATNKRLAWTTANSAIATVTDGVVTAVGVGSTTITATSTDGSNISATCKVQVVANHDAAIAELQALVDNAQSLYDNSTEGENIGQYQSGARAALLAVIKSVKAQINSTMDDATITSCTNDINNAVTTFNSKKVTAGDDTDISAIDNTVYIESIEASAGSQLTLSLNMKNTVSAQGFQCDVYLPEGATFATDEDGFYQAALSTARTTAAKTNYFDCALQGDGALRILCNSTKGYTFSGNDGEVATIIVNLGSDMEEGDYPIIIKEIEISDKESQSYTQSYVKSTLTIKSYTLGDANNDGKITVTDFTAVANAILGNAPATYVEKAADVNLDNKVTVSDLTGIANIILYGSVTGASSNVKARNAGEYTTPQVYIPSFSVQTGSTVCVPVYISNASADFSAYQMDIKLPEGLRVDDARIVEDRTTDHVLQSANMADGSYRLLSYSTKNENFMGKNGAVAILTISADNIPCGSYTGEASNIELSENANPYNLASSRIEINVENATGISQMTEEKNNKMFFNVSGIKSASPMNGINIIRYSDGTVNKILVK